MSGIIDYSEIFKACQAYGNKWYYFPGNKVQKPYFTEVTPAVARKIEASRTKKKKRDVKDENGAQPLHLLVERASGPQTMNEIIAAKFITPNAFVIAQELAKRNEQANALANLGLDKMPEPPKHNGPDEAKEPEPEEKKIGIDALPENFFEPDRQEVELKRKKRGELEDIAADLGIDAENIKKARKKDDLIALIKAVQ